MERMMRLQDVLLKAIVKKISWADAAEIIGVTGQTMRQWRERMEEGGHTTRVICSVGRQNVDRDTDHFYLVAEHVSRLRFHKETSDE
jgi:hypothetical protein